MSGFKPVQIAPPELVLKAVCDGARLGVQLHYVDGAGPNLGRMGAWWCAPRRMWMVDDISPSRALSMLKTIYARDFVSLDGALEMLQVATSPQAWERDYFTQLIDVQIFPLVSAGSHGGNFAVSFAFDKPCIKVMRGLRGLFHKFASAWQVDATSEAILEVLQSQAGIAAEYIFVHDRPVVLEDLTSAGKSTSPITVPAAPPPRGTKGEGGEVQGIGCISTIGEESTYWPVDEGELARVAKDAGLRDYQVAGVRHMISQSGCLLADDMGLGKSRQMVVATRMVAGDGRVLILCPASLRINWEREIKAVYPKAIVGMVGEDRMETLYGCTWIVANYERLGGLVRETGLAIAALCVDEAHFLKAAKAGRTRNAFLMASRIPRRFVVTGTPLLSREVELHTLLRLTGHALGFLELGEFRKKYAGDKNKRAALAHELKGWMLRRSKGELKELGTKTRQLVPIAPSEGMGAYKAVLEDMTLMVMPKITRLRQTLEALKIDFMIETTQSLSDGDKLLVFVEYTSTVKILMQAYSDAGIGCVSLVGSDSARRRQKAVDDFQNDPAVTVFIGTTLAAGVGITLTAANYVGFLSLPWTNALMRQAEDRAYRMGQCRDVRVIVPIIENTLDQGIWSLLTSKQEMESDVVEANVIAALPKAIQVGGVTTQHIHELIRSESACLEDA
jgi:hypothetical protein